MRYRDPEAFRAALEARLRQASKDPQDLSRRRRIVAFDRLLARLAMTDHCGWVLKGGAALEFRMPEQARSTRDIDLALASDLEAADRLLQDLVGDTFGDYFSFRVTRRRELSDISDRGLVVRFSVDVLLGSRMFESIVVDVVAGEGMPAIAERVELGRALGFADVPTVELAVIDLRTHWAEKLSAYLRRYDDRPNTRVKDLVDLVLLVEHGLEPDDFLREAVEATFARRSQHLPRSNLPSMADAWAEPYAEMASDLGLTTVTASGAHDLIESFWRRAQAAGPSTAGDVQPPTT